jgi:hypothetical protein
MMRAGGNKAWLDDALRVILSNLDQPKRDRSTRSSATDVDHSVHIPN